MKRPKVVSLFSGCGGLDLGFKQSGYDIIWANDILKDACETYRHNIGDHIVCGDITKIDKSIIPKADIVIGGPPCQSFSLVGKRNPEDDRSNLVWSYLEVLQRVKPKVFILENVTGILSAKNSIRYIPPAIPMIHQLSSTSSPPGSFTPPIRCSSPSTETVA